MGWLAVDGNGDEVFFNKKPERYNGMKEWVLSEDDLDDALVLQKGSIKKFTGKELTWNDEPLEIKLKEDGKVL